MFLKALTLRGFKSFADKTVLEFEPGVTVVVGPNGSGKSNLVDAVAWVLGAQGPRTMRGGKMDDVVFAGTPQRPALGRAEVSLTIDNSSGLLPIEFSEVTITRTLFRAGDSEYRINDAPCRLLDIQELLSDTGIGRQQHVIVGQGQLDAVLNSRPEDRRAVIEEAAGILKFRKRRERAERRLEATEGSLLRLNDLLREVRRQLTPLQKQADAARRHDGVVAELRALRLHLAGHEIAGLQTRIERLRDQRADHARAEAEVRGRLRDLDVAVLDAESALTIAGHGDLADALARMESVHARAAGLRALLDEKSRGLARELAAVADEGVFETLVADAAVLRRQLEELDLAAGALAADRTSVEMAERELEAARDALPSERADVAVDDVRVLRRELETRRAALARIDAELERVAARLATSSARTADATHARESLVAARTTSREALDRVRAERLNADTATDVAERGLADAEVSARDAHRDAARWQARAEALEQALGAARAGSGIDVLDGLPGVVGPLVDLVEIDAGAEDAVAAVLGDALGALVVEGGRAARDAMARLAAGDVRALLVVAGPAAGVDDVRPPPGTVRLAGSVRTHVPGLQATLARMLRGAVVVDADWASALDVALEHPELTVVTRSGDRFGGNGPWRLGGDAPGVTPAALEEAQERARSSSEAAAASDAARTAAEAEVRMRRTAAAQAAEAERRLVTELEAAEHGLARLDADRVQRSADDAGARAEQAALHEERERDAAMVVSLADRLPGLELAEAEARDRRVARDEATRALADQEREVGERRRTVDMSAAQLTERREVLGRRLTEVEDRLARDPERRALAERHRDALEQRGERYTGISERLSTFTHRVDGLLARWRVARREEAERAAVASQQLQQIRRTRADAERELVELREHAQRREVSEAETRLRLETAIESLRTEHDVEPAAALDAPAPEVPEGTTLAGRARDLERDLRLMGPINPLALEEHEALQERHAFLQEQLEDVKATRRELQRVIKAVDREIVTVFETAFADVQEHFAALFTTLFPGGGGKLSLTDPDDLLSTGIEMEARPSGKNVRRLSLLSGGERSLTALAFLFAVFRARPSPFYLMDEVEAALDDVNLHRFLDLVHEFRDEAQLLIVSHQKRTMEAADCLYGVSMPPGGSSRVVSQRVRDEITVS